MTEPTDLETAPPLELLRAAIDASGLSDRQFAKQRLLRDERTLRRWLAGDSPIGRFPETTQTAVASSNDDLDWSSFGAGAGLVALVAAGIAGVWLTTRKRGGVALP